MGWVGGCGVVKVWWWMWLRGWVGLCGGLVGGLVGAVVSLVLGVRDANRKQVRAAYIPGGLCRGEAQGVVGVDPQAVDQGAERRLGRRLPCRWRWWRWWWWWWWWWCRGSVGG